MKDNTLYLERTGIEKSIIIRKSLKQKYLFFRLFRNDFLSYIGKLLYLYSKKKVVFTDKELNVFYLVRKLMKNLDTEIIPSKFGYLISNDRLHVEVLISTSTIFITNSVGTSDKAYSTQLIKKINGMCDSRLSLRCDNIVKSMLEKEDVVLNRIIKTL